ncbi:DNA/RNA non-specific endonuclease [Flagellimonas onchidii]|uniref:DNA/RNA non-specific endonuclease n=1 Tax=Flagellimonas onchidii TaxID=2562684 RepID=UPI0010A6AA61|nr:DNA/RNA non-specific endonuclease [Allomuricauda onchidii]
MSSKIQIGYDPDFIGDGIRVPLPKFSRSLAQSVLRKPGVLRDDIYSDHIHYTLVMNKHTRQLIYSAYNIDQSKFRPSVSGEGKRSWKNDKDIGPKNQLDNDYYKDRTAPNGEKIENPYDRGHMVMRFNNMWGDTDDESNKAGRATFIYGNSSLQHKNLNRDEWKTLEMKIVRPFSLDSNDKLCVFTGPIYGDLDRHIHLSQTDNARVPSGFFKVICYRSKAHEPEKHLGVASFAVFQDEEVIRDLDGGSVIKINQKYQMTITELQQRTGINFGQALFDRNPLFALDRPQRNQSVNVSFLPERIPIIGSSNIIATHGQIRLGITHLQKRKIIINSAMINPAGDENEGEWISLTIGEQKM